MPGNTVNFMQPGAIIAPDLSVEQAKLQRQYDLAQALRQMSLEQVDGGRGPVSWTQGAAKLAQALAGRSLQRRADNKQLEVNRQYAGRLGPMFGGSPMPGTVTGYSGGTFDTQGRQVTPPDRERGGDPVSGQAPDASAPLSGIPGNHPVTPIDPDAAASPAPPAPASPPTAQAGNQPGPWSLTGDPQQDMALYAMNQDKYGEAVIASHAPTDFRKLLEQSGVNPDSPLGRQIMQSQIAKQNYIAPINGRPGSTIRDPNDPSKVLGYDAPNIEGAFPIYGVDGMPRGYQQAPGAQAAMAGMAGAKAGATAAAQAPYDLVTVVDPNTGAQYQVPKSTITGGAGAPAAGTLNGHYGAGGNSVPSGSPLGNQSGLGPGQQSANTTAGTNSANGFNEAIQGGVQAKNAMRTIDNIMGAAKNLPTGPGSGLISSVKSGVNAVAGAAGMGPVFDPSQIAHFDEMAKNAASLGDQLSSAAGGGTDARLHNALRSLPGDHYSPQAIQEVGTNLKSLQSAASARSQAAAAWQQAHGANSYPQFQQTWQRAYNPDIFYHMQKGDVAQWSKGMSASEREHVMGQYRQMKAMGAF